MTKPAVLVLRAPGTNCDVETAHAFAVAGARPLRIHVNRVIERPGLLNEFQILCIPGGFSFGDDLAAGRIFGQLLRGHAAEAIAQFKARDRLILGICNGFQVLMRTGLLLDDGPEGPPATLAWNDSGRYEDRWVRLRVAESPCVFFRGIETLSLPVAHAEGKFVARGAAVLDELDTRRQIVLRYARPDGATGPVRYPDNPNGSEGDVAGICDRTGRVCGLMPHPERFIDWTQHPQWTRLARRAAGEGLQVFANAVAYFT